MKYKKKKKKGEEDEEKKEMIQQISSTRGCKLSCDLQINLPGPTTVFIT